MDLSNSESASIKTELALQEEGGVGMPYTEIDIEVPDVKKECLQSTQRIHSASKLYSVYMTVHFVVSASVH